MTESCDFDQIVKNLLSMPPVPRARGKAQAENDHDDLDEPQEQGDEGTDDC